MLLRTSEYVLYSYLSQYILTIVQVVLSGGEKQIQKLMILLPDFILISACVIDWPNLILPLSNMVIAQYCLR